MLSNTLTLDEEDAVQEELRQLQEDAVRGFSLSCSSHLIVFLLLQLREAKPDRPINLPSVPSAEPITEPGVSFVDFMYICPPTIS